MPPDWTIDTYVLYRAVDTDLPALSLLMRIITEKHLVTFDHERNIEREYQTCLKKIERERRNGREILNKWFKIVVAKFAQKFSGHLQQRHRTALARLKFDKSDWPFVAVCSKTLTKNLVSEDTDYTAEVRQYLEREMHIRVLSIQQSLEVRT